MATSQIASMLDELMGRNRNFAPDDANARELKWSDAEVCRYYLVHFCPHELFTNTKADLGPCNKIHDDSLKVKFTEEKSDHYKKSQYIDEFLRFCQRMLADLSSRIKKAKERLYLTQEREERLLMESSNSSAAGTIPSLSKEVDEKIILLSEKISALVQEAETAGCSGNVEQAQGLLKLSDQLREERDSLRRSITAQSTTLKDEYAAQQKAMEVCDVCGAFLIVGDAQQRIDDHLLGKQHVGYSRLRAAVDKILEERKRVREERDREDRERRKKREQENKERDEKREKERNERRRQRSRSRDRRDQRRRSRSREVSRRRSRDRRDRRRDRRSRSRSRDRRRSRERQRDRSRDRHNRKRSRSSSRRDRDHRRRSRDRSWSRDRSEKDSGHEKSSTKYEEPSFNKKEERNTSSEPLPPGESGD